MTEAMWLALAVLAFPVVLLLATAGCSSFRPADEPVVEQSPGPSPGGTQQPPPGGGQQPPPGGGQQPPSKTAPQTYVETLTKTPGLIAHWRLGEKQAVLATPNPKAVNSFAMGTHDGRYMNPSGITLEQSGALVPKDLDTAARFTGAAQGFVEVPYEVKLNPDEVSVELWMKLDAAAPEWRVLVGCYEPNLFNDTQIVSGYRVRARTVPAQGAPASIQVQGSFGDIGTPLQVEVPFGSAWHHVVLTYHKEPLGMEAADLYVDDKVASAQKKCDVVLTNPSPLRFAANTGFSVTYFKGALDEVALYGLWMPKPTVDTHRTAATM